MDNPSSYIMDYEKKEIVLTIYTNNAQVETRLSEKDIIAMKNWFKLAKHM
jgi:hypothetical protein